MPDSQRDRSIRNIPVSNGQKHPIRGHLPVEQDYSDYENDEKGIPPPNRPKLPRRRRGAMWFWLGGVVVASAIVGLLLSTVFENATITLTQKTVTLSTPQLITAQPASSATGFSYQSIIATQNASTAVTANGTQHVSRVATGVVTFSNTISVDPQKLIATTRVSTSDGKIYHLKDAVTVPGVVKKANGTLVPGTVSATILADKPGDTYNISAPTQFNLPSFKGTAKYTKLIGQSKDPITGGFVGDEPAISPSDMSGAQNELKRQLDANIRTVASSQIPNGFVAINGSLNVTYTPITQNQGAGNSVTMSQGATAALAIVRVSELAHTLAKQAVKEYTGEDVVFADLSKTLISLPPNTAISNGDPISLTISGTPTLVWPIDKEAVKKALLEKDKANFPSIIKTFQPSITKAEASVRPFWKSSFPSNPSKIDVIINQ